MGLKTTLKNAVDAAFTIVDDLTQSVIYTNPGITVYNPTTGLNTTTGSTTGTMKAIFISQPRDLDNSSDVERLNPQILIKRTDLTETLTVNGFFTVGSVQYEIVSWDADPSDSLYTIDVARST